MLSSRLLRITFLAVVFFFHLTPAFALKRRISAPPPSNTQPSGNCFTFGFVKAGLKGTYLTTSPSGNVSFTITWVSDTATQTVTTQKVTTPQATTDVDTTLDGEVVGPLRGLKHIHVKSTTPVPLLGSVVTDSDLDFVPSLIAGPAQGWCTGATWDVAATTETLRTTTLAGTQTTVQTTAASTGEVLAVNESITVPAGTFRTVKYRGVIVANNSAQTAITWTSMDDAIVVRQDTLDAGGNVTTTTTLQSKQ
jgi:hypothetical protein